MERKTETFILAIESSCDESAAALARVDCDGKFSLLSDRISSQIDVHKLYGGVVPEIASREHLKNLPMIIEQVIQEGGIVRNQIDLIAVTRGPGLKGCLLIGIGIAQGIATALRCPIYGINHMEGHVLAPMIEHPDLEFPFIELVVSGGHTELLMVSGVGDYQVLARTVDDAAGEAFDKSAHLLGFEYPGGAALAQLADRSVNTTFKLPRVMRENTEFSFSGLKTAISQMIRQQGLALADNIELRAQMAVAIQDAIIDALLFKVKRALKETGLKRLALTGGVAANRALRERMSSLDGISVYYPSTALCTDNAAMIAFAAARRYGQNKLAAGSLEVLSRWPVEEIV
jgi:N6-L-threonylcarbamoyladenine synthase